MKVKDLIPYRYKILYLKLKWFKLNFNKINISSKLVANHYHGPITYDMDGLTTSNNADFVNEPRFKKAYQAAVDTKPWDGFTLQWRVYIICWFANHVKNLEGDFVECGVNTGAYSRAIIDYIDFKSLDKKFYLFDTFEGLADELVTEEEKKAGIGLYMGNHYKNVYQQVLSTFSAFNVDVIKGVVPASLKEYTGNNICFLSIDMNVVLPEIEAAEFFWDKLVTGGVIVLDDYGFPQHINQKIAFDEFAKKYNQQILSLPTGQGIIIKG